LNPRLLHESSDIDVCGATGLSQWRRTLAFFQTRASVMAA
jgi:hypothetical protein